MNNTQKEKPEQEEVGKEDMGVWGGEREGF